MDTLGPTNSYCPDYQGALSFQVSLCTERLYFGTLSKSVGYAGVLIFKCQHFPLY